MLNTNYLRGFIGATKTNLKGKSIPHKLVIFESDDWGAIRTPSLETLKEFEKKGLDLANSVYKYDSLESEDDLNALFEVLLKYKDIEGNSPVFTANVIMANPDFEKIEQSNFMSYFHESFLETYKSYAKHAKSFEGIKYGIEKGIFMPQFHGREHLNINRWLKALSEGNENALFCFRHRATYSGHSDYSFMEAFDWDEPEQVEQHNQIINEGLKMFMDVFGFPSKSFIAPCYNWDPKIEENLGKNGIQIIQGIRSQMAPTGQFERYNPIRHYFGEVNKFGTHYSIRNAYLEPSQILNKDWLNSCMAQIRSAFLFNKPAVISTHRINYIGYINENNRKAGLKVLDELLKQILKQWPEVRFISTDKLLNYL